MGFLSDQAEAAQASAAIERRKGASALMGKGRKQKQKAKRTTANKQPAKIKKGQS